MSAPLSQSVRDALADAKQLRVAWRHADLLGAVRVVGQGRLATKTDAPGIYAREAAHAAFKLIPGLRGEE